MLKEINFGNIEPNKFGELVRHMKEISGMTIQEFYNSKKTEFNEFFLSDEKIKARHNIAQLILDAARKGESSVSIDKAGSGWSSAEEMAEFLGLQVEQYTYGPLRSGRIIVAPVTRYKISW